MKQILATFPLRNFLRVFALVTAVSATSCSKDPAVDGELHGDMFVSQSPKRTAGIRSCDAVLPGRKRRALPLRKTSRKYFRSGEKTLRTRCSCTPRSPTESPHRTRMCKPTDCRRVPRPSKRGPFTIRSAYWLRFIRGLGARIPACRIICTMSR